MAERDIQPVPLRAYEAGFRLLDLEEKQTRGSSATSTPAVRARRVRAVSSCSNDRVSFSSSSSRRHSQPLQCIVAWKSQVLKPHLSYSLCMPLRHVSVETIFSTTTCTEACQKLNPLGGTLETRKHSPLMEEDATRLWQASADNGS